MSPVNVTRTETVKGDLHVTFTLRAGVEFKAVLTAEFFGVSRLNLDRRLNQTTQNLLDKNFWLAQPEVKAHLASDLHLAAVAAHKAADELQRAKARQHSNWLAFEHARQQEQAAVFAKADRLAGQARKSFKSPEREALRLFSVNGLEGWRHQESLEKLTLALSR